jgi:endonuclease G
MARSPRRPNGNDLLTQMFRQLPPKAQAAVAITLLVVGLIVAVVTWYQKRHAPPPTVSNPTQQPIPTDEHIPSLVPQMPLGNPSNATADASNRNNYLIEKPYFALSYNESKGTPNWVSWQVRAEDIEGNAARAQVFDTDKTLPPGFKAITHQDYTGSGFDRGHMCPHSDRDAAKVTSLATFVMTNIIPQSPDVNQKAWANLENYCRDLVRRGNRLFIVAGPLGVGGEGLKGWAETIGKGRVTVPAACWKIIVVVPNNVDEKAITLRSRVISVLMQNRQNVGDDWRPFLTTPAEIEKQTGYRFFTSLPPNVAASLRQTMDNGGDR